MSERCITKELVRKALESRAASRRSDMPTPELILEPAIDDLRSLEYVLVYALEHVQQSGVRDAGKV